MAERKSFLLRIDGRVLDAVRAWAEDDLRSLNAQIEYLLREALRRRGRPVPIETTPAPAPDDSSGPASEDG